MLPVDGDPSAMSGKPGSTLGADGGIVSAERMKRKGRPWRVDG
jgi:hypothetical protein